MSIRKRLSISFIMIVLAAACAVSAIAVSASENAAEVSVVQEGYLLKAYDGCIAIYDAESGDKPAIITAIEIKNLTEADRLLMEAGLPVESEEELASLLEDLGS